MTQDINMNLGKNDNLAGLFEAMMGKSSVNPLNQQQLSSNTQPNVGNINQQMSPGINKLNEQPPVGGPQNIYKDMIRAKENSLSEPVKQEVGAFTGANGGSLAELLMKIIAAQGQGNNGGVGITNYRNAN